MPVDVPADDPSPLLKAQQDIIALKMTIQVMLIFLTEAKGDRAYDAPLIATMRTTLMGMLENEAPDDISGPSYELFVEGVKKAIHNMLDPLAE